MQHPKKQQTTPLKPPHPQEQKCQTTYPNPPHPYNENAQKDVTVLSKPITKELKESLNIKNKTIVEMNLDVTQFLIQNMNDKTEKQYIFQKNCEQVYPFPKKVLYGE